MREEFDKQALDFKRMFADFKKEPSCEEREPSSESARADYGSSNESQLIQIRDLRWSVDLKFVQGPRPHWEILYERKLWLSWTDELNIFNRKRHG